MKSGDHCIYVSSVDSTNQYVKRIISNYKIKSGTVVYTFDQYEGLGQYGTQWYSQNGKSLAFSMYYEPLSLSPEHVFTLNMLVSNGLAAGLQSLLPGHNVKIKWPNDIVVEDDKLAGVLIQNALKKQVVLHSVIGIGVNVNQTHFEASYSRKPTSMALLTSLENDPGKVLHTLLQSLNHHLPASMPLQKPKVLFEKTREVYLDRLYGYDKWQTFQRSDSTIFQGKVINVEPDGRICITDQEGNLQKYDLKEISWVTR